MQKIHYGYRQADFLPFVTPHLRAAGRFAPDEFFNR
jgi:hypothetical protein